MLKERETQVLKQVVQEFVETNKPVGSEKLAMRLGISSASVRNTMNMLLREGFLCQPHTSAGREPTDTGYRYFVDYLIEEYMLAEAEGYAVRECLDVLQARLERMLRDVAAVLSSACDCMAFVAVPQLERCSVTRLDITRVSSRRALIVLVLSSGMVETQFAQLPQGLEDLPLDRIAARLNERLHGRPVSAVSPEFLEAVFAEVRLTEDRLRLAIRKFFSDLIFSFSRRVFVDGADEIISQPEFRDAGLLRPVLEIVSEDNPELNVFRPPAGDRIQEVTIGCENAIEPLYACSVVKSHFVFGDSTTGAVGIIGPRRMHYPRAMRLVGFTASALSSALAGLTLS